MPNNKYKARSCYYSPSQKEFTTVAVYDDSEYFASRHEAQVYIELLKIPNVEIRRQEKICLKPPTPVYDATMWRCDFVVVDPTNGHAKYCLVEAKGMVTREFKLLIQQFEFFQHYDWERLVIVSQDGGNKIDEHITSVPISQLNEVVLSKLSK